MKQLDKKTAEQNACGLFLGNFVLKNGMKTETH